MKPEYQVCVRCVMDTTDERIVFDQGGVCNHCLRFDTVVTRTWFPNDEGARRLEEMVRRLKAGGKGKPYDCILGLSGGVDSCYLALRVKEWGLRPLVMHVDAGWNSELAVANIEKIVRHCGFDLHTHVVDWDEIRRLQMAYLRSGVANQDVPQDHVFFASLYRFALSQGIRTILTGGNIATESVFPSSWHAAAMDRRNLVGIFKRFGEGRLRSYTTVSFWQYYFWFPFVRGLRVLRPLNYLPYHKEEAVEELKAVVGWRPYSRKHGESLFTKFFQNHYLPTRFGYDKRRPHLSSLILSGQMTREAALEKLAEPLYEAEELQVDINFFCKKMQISPSELKALMDAPARHYSEFPNQDRMFRLVKGIQSAASAILGRPISAYS